MSYYYTYHLGIQDKDNKIRPLGPYDADGTYFDVLNRPASYASDLHEMFYPVTEEMWTPELEKEYSYESYEGVRKRYDIVRYLPLKELPSGSFIKRGYFLIEDIDRYMKSLTDSDIYFDGFYNCLSQEAYIRMMENELKFGRPAPVTDDFGETYTPRSCADYAYFAYPDYESKEYECFIISEIAEMLETYRRPEGSQIIVLETEG